MPEFGQRFYEEDEAEQILRRASSLSMPGGAMNRERLLQTAAELGISPEAVELAERQIALERTEKTERAEFDTHVRSDFFGHLVSFVCVNGFLVAINLRTGGYFWAIWPMLAWGLGLAFDFVETFFRGSESYREEFDKWRLKRLRKQSGSRNLVGNMDFLIEEYVQRRIRKGRDLSKLDAIRYVRLKAETDSKEAAELVEQYVSRNPGVLD
jgi:hypothetical protein